MSDGTPRAFPPEIKAKFGKALGALVRGEFGAAWVSLQKALRTAEQWDGEVDGHVVAAVVDSILVMLNEKLADRYGKNWTDVVDLPQHSAPPPCCSFCGKKEEDVKRLLGGAVVAICDECIGICNDALAESKQ